MHKKRFKLITIKFIRFCKLKDLSIRLNLFLAFGLILFIMMLLSFITFQKYSRDKEDSVLLSVEKMSANIMDNLDENIENMCNAAKILLISKENGNYSDAFNSLDISNTTGSLDLSFSRSLYEETFNIMFFNPNIHSICVFNIKGDGGYSAQDGQLYIPDFKPASEEWFKNSLDMLGSPVYISTFNITNNPAPGKEIYVFSVARAIMKINESKPIGVILVNSSISSIDQMIKNTILVPYQKSIIIDKDGKIIYDTDKKNIAGTLDSKIYTEVEKNNKVLKNIKIDGEDCLMTAISSELTGWKLINIIQLNELNKNIIELRKVTAVIAIILLIIALSFIILFSLKITKPLKKLMLLMNLVEKGDFDVKIRIPNRNELGKLAKTFNKMTGRVKKLINEVYVEKINQRELELQMLKNQINPHFLYNTLESIRMVAEYNNIPKISDMAFSLGKILRFGINTQKEIVTIAEEVEYLNYYVKLQSYRFENMFKMVINIDRSILDCTIIKLILQPVVENAIYHGLSGIKEGGIIEISGTLEGNNIVFAIKDNGKGMDIETVNSLNDYLNGLNSNFKSIGLKNVHKRIQLFYGNSYGLKISSICNIGTEVVVTIPLKCKIANNYPDV